MNSQHFKIHDHITHPIISNYIPFSTQYSKLLVCFIPSLNEKATYFQRAKHCCELQLLLAKLQQDSLCFLSISGILSPILLDLPVFSRFIDFPDFYRVFPNCSTIFSDFSKSFPICILCFQVFSDFSIVFQIFRRFPMAFTPGAPGFFRPLRLRRLVDWFQAPGEGFRAPGARLAAGLGSEHFPGEFFRDVWSKHYWPLVDNMFESKLTSYDVILLSNPRIMFSTR